MWAWARRVCAGGEQAANEAGERPSLPPLLHTASLLAQPV